MTNETNKPAMSCPCCDGEELDLFRGEYADHDPFWYVVCLDCGTEGPHGASEAEACRLWDAKHARHRIGERNALPVHAPTAVGATAPMTVTAQESVMPPIMKSYFFALAAGLIKTGD